MKKSLQMQAQMLEASGACTFDVTLDCEDGAPVGGEVEQAHLVAELALHTQHQHQQHRAALPRQRVGARLHPVDHPAFGPDVAIVLGKAASALSYIMIPKVESCADVDRAAAAMDAAVGAHNAPPLHVLIESPAAVQQAFAIAAHARVESVSFGLMDFVSAHGGAIGSSAMTVRAADDHATLDQFHHPLVVRAKTEIASACHAYGKVPSHCVVTEFRNRDTLARAARYAANALGFTRMWSIHPDQIATIVQAFAPTAAELELAATIIDAAARQEWAPISIAGTLHDRASYRYFWQLMERAHATGCTLPESMRSYFSAPSQYSE